MKVCVASGLPPNTEATDQLMSNILTALMDGNMWLWVVMNENGPFGVITGAITQDICVRLRNLLVYSVWFATEPSVVVLQNILHVLVDFSKTQGCVKLAGFVNNTKALEALSKMKNVQGMFYVEAWTNGRRT